MVTPPAPPPLARPRAKVLIDATVLMVALCLLCACLGVGVGLAIPGEGWAPLGHAVIGFLVGLFLGLVPSGILGARRLGMRPWWGPLTALGWIATGAGAFALDWQVFALLALAVVVVASAVSLPGPVDRRRLLILLVTVGLLTGLVLVGRHASDARRHAADERDLRATGLGLYAPRDVTDLRYAVVRTHQEPTATWAGYSLSRPGKASLEVLIRPAGRAFRCDPNGGQRCQDLGDGLVATYSPSGNLLRITRTFPDADVEVGPSSSPGQGAAWDVDELAALSRALVPVDARWLADQEQE